MTSPACPLQPLRAAVLRATGADISAYKESVVLRRVRVRVKALGLSDPAEYAARIAREGPGSPEARALVRALSVPVSGFFRDPGVFSALEGRALPRLLEDGPGEGPLRIWSVGCSRGQEAYSLALVARGALRRAGLGLPFEVLGTDVDEEALAAARRGEYGDRDLEGVPQGLRAEGFERVGQDRWRVKAGLRERVRFARADLLDMDDYPGGFHLIACRYVLIYLRRPVQVRVILALEQALRPGGLLVLGASETLLGRPWTRFEHLEPSLRIYRKPLRAPAG